MYGGTEKFQNDPHWKDYLLFHEYFHGDNGAGLGASHQTGWTGLVATMIELFGWLDGAWSLEVGKAAAFARGKQRGNRQSGWARYPIIYVAAINFGAGLFHRRLFRRQPP